MDEAKVCCECGAVVTLDTGYYDGPEGVYCMECDRKDDIPPWADEPEDSRP